MPTTLAWSCYLGSSWTWVIGMVWPAIIVRDYGVWGWVAFAAPNVLGAAAMGFVLRDPALSRRIVANHGRACEAFSAVTVLFHAYAVGWLSSRCFGPAGWVAPALLAAVFVRSAGRLLPIGVLVTFVSWLCFAVLGGADAAWPDWRAMPASIEQLVIFAAIAPIGFLLCPYLDLTFHHAVQQTGSRAPVAFAVGFGVVFLSMIVFSLAYADVLAPALSSGAIAEGAAIAGSPLWRGVLAVHLAVQVAFTCALHLSRSRASIRDRAESRSDAGGLGRRSVVWLCALVPIVVGLVAFARNGSAIGRGEAIFCGFLLFYGVVFPAYVLMFVVPTRTPIDRRVRTVLLVVATVIACPLGWIGLAEARSWSLVGAGAIVLLARILLDLFTLASQVHSE